MFSSYSSFPWRPALCDFTRSSGAAGVSLGKACPSTSAQSIGGFGRLVSPQRAIPLWLRMNAPPELVLGSLTPTVGSVVSRLFRTLVGGVLRLSEQGVTLLEQFHVQIPFGRPPRGGDVT